MEVVEVHHHHHHHDKNYSQQNLEALTLVSREKSQRARDLARMIELCGSGEHGLIIEVNRHTYLFVRNIYVFYRS